MTTLERHRPLLESYTVRYVSLFILFFGLSVDTVSTVILVRSNHFKELNPLMSAAIDVGGIYGIIFVKVAIYTIIVYGATKWADDVNKAVTASSFAAGGAWLLAGGWNLYMVSLVV